MQTTDIGHGRGWLDAPAAASVARIDAQLGRPLGLNRAGGSAAEQQEKRDAWLAYRAGTGPWAPLALPPEESWHCQGLAVDTDDPAREDVMPRNGWRFPVGGEPWHGQYYLHLDQHTNDAPQTESEDDMKAIIKAGQPDSGIIIQAGTPPYSLGKQVFDALCGAYNLTARTLEGWQYDTAIREQWIAAGAAANLEPASTAGLSDEDLQKLIAAVHDAATGAVNLDELLAEIKGQPAEFVEELTKRLAG
jgi:hypothetical protein